MPDSLIVSSCDRENKNNKDAQDQADKATTRKFDCPDWQGTAISSTLLAPLGYTLLVGIAYCMTRKK